MRYIYLLIITLFSVACTPKTEIEKEHLLLMDRNSIYKSAYENLQLIKEDTEISYAELFKSKDGNRPMIVHLLAYAFTKWDSIGLYMLMSNALTEKQQEAILLFYEPFPEYHEIALEILAIKNPQKLSEYDEIKEKIKSLKPVESNQFDEYFKNKNKDKNN